MWHHVLVRNEKWCTGANSDMDKLIAMLVISVGFWGKGMNRRNNHKCKSSESLPSEGK